MPVKLLDTEESGLFRFMFYGINGTGKTTLAHRLSDAMVLRIVTDKGGVSLHGYEDGRLAKMSKRFPNPDNLNELHELLDGLRADDERYRDFDLVCFDNVSAFQRNLVSRLVRSTTWSQNGKVRTNRVLGDSRDRGLGPHVENAGNDDYMWVANTFRLVVNKLIASPKNVVFIAQRKELGKQDNDKSIRPDLSEGNENSIGHVAQASGETKQIGGEFRIDFRQEFKTPDGLATSHSKSWIPGLKNKIVTHDEFIQIAKDWQKGVM